ncbi:ribosome maturation factor RimM [Cyanobacterium aponinum]|uniref:Ribosome maturation factor RimM n=1 Tax=Cyanobacterium aponinum (strain PCC 10605) TaxID=755178 RepID=K9Z6J4_CYAAP|nr:ribosome maturation factor RimM [Cyanobacterium aponinum]AFZ54811.1 16S rRNA processing protein RimM [Cyanobacterium aponinum PCC 10605]
MEIKDLIAIGTIVAPQGLKGELKVKTDSDFPERFETAGVRWITSPSQKQPQPVDLLQGRQIPGKNIFIIKLAQVCDRNQAETLKGSTLYVEKTEKPYLEPGEYHVADLINLEVYNQQTGENIGIVIDVLSAGNDILEVKLHKQPEIKTEEKELDISKISRISKRKKVKIKKPKPVTILIPFVEEIVPIVDLENCRIEVNPPTGLLNPKEAEEVE